MEIKDIKQFMEWCAKGSETYPQRRALFLKQKEHVEAEIQRMNQALDMLKYKCWYYFAAAQSAAIFYFSISAFFKNKDKITHSNMVISILGNVLPITRSVCIRIL